MNMFCDSACINKAGRINNILQPITIITLYSTTNMSYRIHTRLFLCGEMDRLDFEYNIFL